MDKVYIVVNVRLGQIVYIGVHRKHVDWWLRIQLSLFRRSRKDYVVTTVGVGYQAVEFVGPDVAHETYLYAPAQSE